MRTNGLKTNRDAWNWNSSRSKLEANTARMIDHYNSQVETFLRAHPDLAGTQKERAEVAKAYVDRDPQSFSWDRADFKRVVEGRKYSMDETNFMVGTYRPFHRRHTNSAYNHNNTIYQLPKVYPHDKTENLTIAVSTKGARSPFSTFMTRDLPELHLWVDDTPCFPLYIYDTPHASDPQGSLLDDGEPARHHNVTDHALDLYRDLDPDISKNDIFFYVYGILHSPDYREAYAADLKRSLPRIPKVETADDFWAFSRAGQSLSRLHTDYEEVEPWLTDLETQIEKGFDTSTENLYRVEKMRYTNDEHTAIAYNGHISISGIPERVHDYKLGARSALDWVLENNRIRTDRKSGITNDPNDWAFEHDNPSYIFDLIGRIVTVSMQTLDIVEGLPRLNL